MGFHRSETVRDAAGQGTQEFTTNEGIPRLYAQGASGPRTGGRTIRGSAIPTGSRRKLLRAKYGTNRFYSSDIQMRDGKEGVAFAINTPGGHARMLSTGTVSASAREPADAEGFASMFNNGKSPANRITADNVKVLSDGNFRVRKNGRESFYTPSMSTTRGTRSRNGKLLRLQRGRRFHMELPNR